MAYDINYNDKRFTQVEADKNVAIKESDSTFDNMINQSDGYYQAQIDAAKQWGDTQAKNQQERTDFTIEQINQQKDQAHKDYQKEQSGAYVDWQKQSNQYGPNAEQMASSGLAHTGYSESSQVSMYNAYQNRVAAARESYNKAVLNYNNAITEARLQNNSALAEIAYKTLQQSLELSLQGFQYKNQLILQKAAAKRELDNIYYSRYQDTLSQLNTENALAEQVRQYNKSLAEEKRQYNESLALQKQQLKLQKKNSNVSKGSTASANVPNGEQDNPKGASYIDKKDENGAKAARTETWWNRIKQQVGMNRSSTGRVNAINKLYKEGTISEAEAKELLEYYAG